MSREETFGLERIRLSDTGIPISTIILPLQSIPERYSEMRYMNQNQNQNQNQFYFRVDVKTLKQLWATIGDSPKKSSQVKSSLL